MLTNAEVLWRIEELRSKSTVNDCPENLALVINEILSHFKQRPAGNLKAPQTAENISGFMKELGESGIYLEKAEVLQIINNAPTSLPVLFNIIEECEDRLDEEQTNRLLELCEKYLGFEPNNYGDQLE